MAARIQIANRFLLSPCEWCVLLEGYKINLVGDSQYFLKVNISNQTLAVSQRFV